MTHRREGFAFLGIPFVGFIDIDDSEALIRAVEMTDKEIPIDLMPYSRPDRERPVRPHPG